MTADRDFYFYSQVEKVFYEKFTFLAVTVCAKFTLNSHDICEIFRQAIELNKVQEYLARNSSKVKYEFSLWSFISL